MTLFVNYLENEGGEEGGEEGEKKEGKVVLKEIEVDPLLSVEEVVLEVLEVVGEEAAWENCGFYISKDGLWYVLLLSFFFLILFII